MVLIISMDGRQKIPPCAFVRFKMNTCTYCINSQGEWDKACNAVKNKYPANDVGMVEIESEFGNLYKFVDENGLPFNVSGYPTHAMFHNNKLVHTYEQERRADLFEKELVDVFGHQMLSGVPKKSRRRTKRRRKTKRRKSKK